MSVIADALAHRCTRCDITLRRAFYTAALTDAGATSNINPLQCELPDGKLADHDFQPAGAKQ